MLGHELRIFSNVKSLKILGIGTNREKDLEHAQIGGFSKARGSENARSNEIALHKLFDKESLVNIRPVLLKDAIKVGVTKRPRGPTGLNVHDA